MNTIIDKIDLWTTAQELKTSNRGRSASNQSLLGIKKLRELILELAVRGKLVSQDPNDEPASELIKKIEAEKRKLIKEGKVKKQEGLPEVGEDEKPFDLPKRWEWVRLQQIIQISSGDGLIAANMNSDGTVPVFGGNGINGYHDKANVDKSTLVIGRVGFYCGSIHITPQSAWVTDNAFITIFSEENIYINFLYWLLKGTNLKENENATAQPVISGRKVYPIVVGLPPLAEQHRIVAKVEELMALCDELEKQQTDSNAAHETLVATLLSSLTDFENSNSFNKSWLRIATHFDTIFTTEHSIDQFKQTILQLAVMGKLGGQNLNKIQIENCLQNKLIKQRSKLKLGKGVIVDLDKDISPEEKPYVLPQNWLWIRLGKIVEIIGGSQPPKNKFGYSPQKGYTRLIQIRDFKSDDFQTFVPNEFADRPFNTDDIMIGRYGPPVFQILRGKKGTYNVALMKAEPIDDCISKDYLYYLLSEPRIQNKVISESDRTAGQSGVRKELLYMFCVGLPPISEQHQIVSKVDELFALCEGLKERLVEAKTLQNQMAGAVVEQALN